MASFQGAPGSGFTPVPGLERLDPGPGPVRIPAPARLPPRGRGACLTEACDAPNSCVEANGGRRAPEQSDSAAAGCFKAPNADASDNFGQALALSGDGSMLAAGARREGGASIGAFVPTDGAGCQAALDSDESRRSAASSCRRSDAGVWAVEAFAKAPDVSD